MTVSVSKSISFPEDIFCPSSDTEDSQQDELLLLEDHLNKKQGRSATSSFQDMIKNTFDLSSSSNKGGGGNIRDDVLKWEQKLKADATKSKALKLKQLKRAAASSSSSNKAKKSLPRDVVNTLEEMENDAEEVVRMEQQRWMSNNNNNNPGSSSSSLYSTKHHDEQRNEYVEQSQTKYKESLYRLGTLEQKITEHETSIKKCTRKSLRSVGVTMEHKHRIKTELHFHKTELAKAEREMIEMRKVVDSQLRALFLIKLYKELEVQEEGVRGKEAEVKKWEIILRKAEEGLRRSGNCDDVDDKEEENGGVDSSSECSSSSSSSSSSSDEEDEEFDEIGNKSHNNNMSSSSKKKKILQRGRNKFRR